MRNVLIVSGRVLLSDVSSPPREVRTPAADDDRRDGRDSPRRTGSARAVAPRTKTTVGRRCAAAGGPPGDTAPRAGHRPPPPRAPGPRPRVTAPPSMGHRPEETRQAGERPRRGRHTVCGRQGRRVLASSRSDWTMMQGGRCVRSSWNAGENVGRGEGRRECGRRSYDDDVLSNMWLMSSGCLRLPISTYLRHRGTP